MTTVVSPALISDQILHVRDEKSSGTGGGSFTNGAWRTRTLNTEKTNTITGASLSSNQITLPTGSYVVEFGACGSQVQRHQTRFYNTSDASAVLYGKNNRVSDSVGTGDWSEGKGYFTITASKTFELQHRCETSDTNDGFGEANSFGGVEVYADVFITKVG